MERERETNKNVQCRYYCSLTAASACAAKVYQPRISSWSNSKSFFFFLFCLYVETINYLHFKMCYCSYGVEVRRLMLKSASPGEVFNFHLLIFHIIHFDCEYRLRMCHVPPVRRHQFASLYVSLLTNHWSVPKTICNFSLTTISCSCHARSTQ